MAPTAVDYEPESGYIQKLKSSIKNVNRDVFPDGFKSTGMYYHLYPDIWLPSRC